MTSASVWLTQQSAVYIDLFPQTDKCVISLTASPHPPVSFCLVLLFSFSPFLLYLSPSLSACMTFPLSFCSLYEIKMERGKERPKQEREKEAINSGAFDMLIHSVSLFSAVHRLPLHTHTHTQRGRGKEWEGWGGGSRAVCFLYVELSNTSAVITLHRLLMSADSEEMISLCRNVSQVLAQRHVNI